jgi:hypothetical protein
VCRKNIYIYLVFGKIFAFYICAHCDDTACQDVGGEETNAGTKGSYSTVEYMIDVGG